jgi:hypothetical protein
MKSSWGQKLNITTLLVGIDNNQQDECIQLNLNYDHRSFVAAGLFNKDLATFDAYLWSN